MSKKFPAGVRGSVLSFTAVAALLAGASGASATSFTYTSYQAVTGTSFLNAHITYTNTTPTHNTYGDGAAVNEYGGMGEITLVASTGPADNLNVFCMDIYHWLASSGTSTEGPLGLSGSGVPNPTLSTVQLNQISHLVNDASTVIGAATTLPNKSQASAALQLAIWEIEYKTDALGVATLASGPSGPTFIPDDSSLLALAASYIATLAGDGSTSAGAITLLTTTGNIADQQDLVYIADCGPTGCGIIGQSPLPGALPLLASGLGAFGFIGWRRKRKAAAA